MEQEIQFIQYQLWFVIALFFLLIATNVICYFVRKSEKDNDPRFGEMWEKGEIDKLLKKSGEYLIDYPNHAGALYFRSKALVAKRESLPEARGYLKKLIQNEPTLIDQTQKIIDEIEKIEGS